MILRANTALADQSSWVSDPRAAGVWSGPESLQNVANCPTALPAFPPSGALSSSSQDLSVCAHRLSDDGGLGREKELIPVCTLQAFRLERHTEHLRWCSGNQEQEGPFSKTEGLPKSSPGLPAPNGVIEETFLGSLLNSEQVSPNLRPSDQ